MPNYRITCFNSNHIPKNVELSEIEDDYTIIDEIFTADSQSEAINQAIDWLARMFRSSWQDYPQVIVERQTLRAYRPDGSIRHYYHHFSADELPKTRKKRGARSE